MSTVGRAWVYSLPVLIVVGGYILLFYKAIFNWYLMSAVFFFLIALSSTVLVSWLPFEPFTSLYTELVMLVLLLFLLLMRKRLQFWVTSITTKKLSMMNNLSEMFRFSLILSLITVVHITVYLLVSLMQFTHQVESHMFLKQLFLLVLVLFALYQTVRVFAIRHQLMKEEWWPIVNHVGREIGSIHYQNSLLLERQKFMHPVVRVIVMEGTRMLLHQNAYAHSSGVHQWDHALDAHVQYGENVGDCIRRVAEEFYGITKFNPVFLTNYKIENSCEYQFVHLFVSGRIQVERVNPHFSQRVKWWTLSQICEELRSGIFTENFVREYDLLMRSGLIDESACDCECNLRDTVHGKKTLA